MAFDPKDPDANLVVFFKSVATINQLKSVKAGRPIYDDEDRCEIRIPGSRDTSIFPALAFSHWVPDEIHGGQRPITYAERFRRQFQQFKERQVQTKSGTPLDYAPFLTDGKRAELRALNIYTVEQLADIDGQPLKNLGPFGREYKNQAQQYLDDSSKGAVNRELAAELEALRARNQVLEEDAMQRRAAAAEVKKAVTDQRPGEAEFEDMSIDALNDFIRVNTGTAPQGSPNRRTLIRMAMEARQEKAA